jgi:glycosyltransferase involved in cell wall biosynthesis
VQNGVDVDYFKPSATTDRSNTIVFEGNMSFSPNEDAAEHLVRDIFPRVASEFPNSKVVLVGKDPSPRVRALAGPRVEVTGFVRDVRPYLDAAAVFACPMRKGAGIKNKVLQAWAMGKPVVATSKATGGLMAREGENILVRDDPGAFADALIQLIRDPARRAALSAAARDTALSGYTWDRQCRALEAVMERVSTRHAHAGV